MSEFIQDIGNTEVAGLGNSISGGRDRSAEVGFAQNIIETGVAGIKASAQHDLEKQLASLQDFTEIEKRAGTAFLEQTKRIEETSSGSLTNQQSAAQLMHSLSKSRDKLTPEESNSRLELVSQAVGRPVTNEEADKFVGTAYFEGLRAALVQGHKTENAVMIAAERQTKKLIAAHPELADEIRKTAAREIGFDPAGEFKMTLALLGRNAPEKKEAEKTPRDKFSDEAMQIARANSGGDPAKFQSGYQELMGNYDKKAVYTIRNEALKAQIDSGVISGEEYLKGALANISTVAMDNGFAVVSKALADSGFKLDGISVVTDEQRIAAKDALNTLIASQTAEIVSNTNRAGKPVDITYVSQQVKAAYEHAFTMLDDHEQTAQLTRAIDLFNKKANLSAQQAFGFILPLQAQLGSNFEFFMNQLNKPDNQFLRAQWSKDASLPPIEVFKEWSANFGKAVQASKLERVKMPSAVDEVTDPSQKPAAPPTEDETKQTKAVEDALKDGPITKDGSVEVVHVRKKVRSGRGAEDVFMAYVKAGEPIPEDLKSEARGQEQVFTDQVNLAGIVDRAIQDSFVSAAAVAGPRPQNFKDIKFALDVNGNPYLLMTYELPESLTREKGTLSQRRVNLPSTTQGMLNTVANISGSIPKETSGLQFSSKQAFINMLNSNLKGQPTPVSTLGE